MHITKQSWLRQQQSLLLRSIMVLPLGREAYSSPSAFFLLHYAEDSSFPAKGRTRSILEGSILEGRLEGRSIQVGHWGRKTWKQLGFRVAVELWETPWDLYPFWRARQQMLKNASHKPQGLVDTRENCFLWVWAKQSLRIGSFACGELLQVGRTPCMVQLEYDTVSWFYYDSFSALWAYISDY